jgi:hypothetical protein
MSWKGLLLTRVTRRFLKIAKLFWKEAKTVAKAKSAKTSA